MSFNHRFARAAGMASGAGLILLALAGRSAATTSTPPQPASVSPQVTASCSQPMEDVVRAQICFDPATHLVRITMPQRDSHGYPIPALTRDSFVVYEDGVRQNDVNVEIQRAPLTLGVLLEHGGRYHTLNDTITDAVSQSATALVDEALPKDRTAVWTYGDTVTQVLPFSSGRLALQQALDKVDTTAPLTETNLYDALTTTLSRMQQVRGRKALLLISSGVDTFSKTSYREALQAARDSGVPIYVINLTGILQQDPSLNLQAAPYSHLDWKHASTVLAQIARVSGGRMYTPDFTVDFHAIYDDLLEQLRARYVLTYHSSSTQPEDSVRNVRVELVDGHGKALLASGEKGRPPARLTVVDSYTPRAAMAAG